MIRTENEYRFDSPGVVSEVFSQFRGEGVRESMDTFTSYAHQDFDYSYTNNTRLNELLDEVAKRMGFCRDTDLFHEIVKPAFFLSENVIVYIENQHLLLGELQQRLSLGQKARLFLVFGGDAGEVFRNEDAGLRYSFHAHEGNRHNMPHLHVVYRHEHEASFSLYDGTIIAGNMPSKPQKKGRGKDTGKQRIPFNTVERANRWD